MNPINLSEIINASVNITNPRLIIHEFISLNYDAYIIGNAFLSLWLVLANRYDKSVRIPLTAIAVLNFIMLGFQFVMIPFNNWSII
jgi:hypothetical protein